ncbi:hypothetical protein [Neoroseomonas soli]|uniref:Uncharacterized protein n=1 Tax=Neoroseomonas soli TaxID=1081025 RepID=A0A9X9WTT0_9PROT|nr:hypothetical protein [Neoroseomonas soli]MBR0670559.1 hypothetical protein [Neoroseomonas soli]
MTTADTTEHLTLLEAMIRWCDGDIVDRIGAEERKNLAYHLRSFSMPKLLDESEWLQPTAQTWAFAGDLTLLIAAWEDLAADFRRRVERGELYLEGVLSGEDPDAQPEAIPNFWASELHFDLTANVATRAKRRYLAISVSKRPSPWTALGRAQNGDADPPLRFDAGSVARLSGEEILYLLEEHARRVIASPDATLIPPGKISLLPIVKGKMVHRAEQGELMPSLSQEAAALAAWIASKVTLHQTPTASTIAKVLGKKYAALRARSSGAIQRDRK